MNGKSYPLACGQIARVAATIEARFLAGRTRLAFGPPGSWPRSPQIPLKQVTVTQLPRDDQDREPG